MLLNTTSGVLPACRMNKELKFGVLWTFPSRLVVLRTVAVQPHWYSCLLYSLFMLVSVFLSLPRQGPCALAPEKM